MFSYKMDVGINFKDFYFRSPSIMAEQLFNENITKQVSLFIAIYLNNTTLGLITETFDSNYHPLEYWRFVTTFTL